MNTTLLTDITIEEICDGFVYDKKEGKGLYGWSGKLLIQPEYQRNYLYCEAEKEEPVIDSVLKGYPLGLLYFNKVGENKYEVLDGQQRITSLGRFLTNRFAIEDSSGVRQIYDGLDESLKEKILKTKLTIYICEGEEPEIKAWFRTINISGIELNEQEESNAVFSGPFVSEAKKVFSNSQNSNLQKWSAYINAKVNRQEFLRKALEWVVKSTKTEDVEEYMSRHRRNPDISELTNYFDSVIDWVSSVFLDTHTEMKTIPWGTLYEKYHNNPYNPREITKRVQELREDEAVENKKGIYEYVLGGCTETRLLGIHLFDPSTKATVYERQTAKAKQNGESNCPLCALGHTANSNRIWKLNEMDADHVAAWSRGGSTDISNCQMLCITHNRAKGNR